MNPHLAMSAIHHLLLLRRLLCLNGLILRDLLLLSLVKVPVLSFMLFLLVWPEHFTNGTILLVLLLLVALGT
jgi:hypothetical protein